MSPPLAKRFLRILINSVVVLFLGACATHYAPGAARLYPEIANQIVSDDHYPQQKVTFSNSVTGLANLTYATIPGYRPLKLDLYLPPETLSVPEEGYPLVVFIHGGAWLGGDLHRNGAFVDFPEVLGTLSARGYVVASVSYRLSGEAKFPAQEQDVKTAIRWLRFHAADYKIDPQRVIAWGVSAGGHLSAMTAVSCNAQEFEMAEPIEDAAPGVPPSSPYHSTVPDCVQGAVAWFGVFDFSTIASQARQESALSRDVPDAPEWSLLGCFSKSCSAQQIRIASPVTYVDSQDPSMLLITGDQDMEVPHQQSKEMADKLRAAGVSTDLMVLPGLDHFLIGPTLDQTRDGNLKALDVTFQFFDRISKKASTPAK